VALKTQEELIMGINISGIVDGFKKESLVCIHDDQQLFQIGLVVDHASPLLVHFHPVARHTGATNS